MRRLRQRAGRGKSGDGHGGGGDGNVTARVDGRGVTTSYTYSDPANLLTNFHYTLPSTVPTGLAGTPDVNLTDDSFGRTATVDNGGIKTSDGFTVAARAMRAMTTTTAR